MSREGSGWGKTLLVDKQISTSPRKDGALKEKKKKITKPGSYPSVLRKNKSILGATQIFKNSSKTTVLAILSSSNKDLKVPQGWALLSNASPAPTPRCDTGMMGFLTSRHPHVT